MSDQTDELTTQIQMNLEDYSHFKDTQHLTLLSPRLSVMMISLSILTFCVFGWLVPYLFERSTIIEKRTEAELAARSLSIILSRISSTYPNTWIYHFKTLQKESLIITNNGSFVQVSSKQGFHYLITPNGIRKMRPQEPQLDHALTGTASIVSQGIQGEVTVYLITKENHDSKNLWWIALLLGGITSMMISVIPLKISQKGDEQNRILWQALTKLNQTLESKIKLRTQELDLLNVRLMSVQEEERARISRDLHDELGQTLTASRLQLTTALLLQSQSPQAQEMFAQGIKELDRGVEQVRSIAYALRPPELDELGLVIAIKRHIERRAHSANLKAIFYEIEFPVLSKELSTTVFRVVQEGLTNVIRHAQATQVTVTLSVFQTQQILIQIQDNGQGLPKDISEGVGIIGIRSRAREHTGQVYLKSDTSGTTLSVILTYQASKSTT